MKRIRKRRADLNKAKIEGTINAVIEAIAEALEQGDRVELRGFGTLSVRRYRARLSRNPYDNVEIGLRPRALPFFRIAKGMYDRLNKAEGF
jgi:integration host factor subunit beta